MSVISGHVRTYFMLAYTGRKNQDFYKGLQDKNKQNTTQQL
jgi:hypothetical protein